MTDQALDDLARRVMLDAARQEYGDWIDQLPEHDFSPKFERKMKKLIRRANHPIRYRVAQIVACLLLTALLSGCAVLAVSPEFREAFTGWVWEVYETYFVYRYNGSEEEMLEDTEYLPTTIVYRPTWTPDGWRESEASEDKATTYVFYENAEGASMVFICTKDPKASTVYLDKGNDVNVQEVQVQDGKADLYMDRREGYSNVIVWKDERTDILLLINGPLTEAELVKMAESVEAMVWPETLEEYRLAWVPGGYQEYEQVVMGRQTSRHTMYRNEEGNLIVLMCVRRAESTGLHIVPTSSEGIDVLSVEVNGVQADLYLEHDEKEANLLVWTDNDTGMLFAILAHCSGDELVKMAESVEVVPKEVCP